jgi:hypothetical protein
MWRTKRLLIYLVGFLISLSLLIFSLFWYFYPTASCIDGKQNQNEQGVDCGGVCPKACISTTLAPKVLWIRVLPAGSGKYDVAVAIENQNSDRGVKNIGYKIRIYDKQGVILNTREGSTYLNPLEKAVVVESGFDAGKQVAVSADFNIVSQSAWLQAVPIPPAVYIERIIEENDFSAPSTTPKLRVKVTNRSLLPLKNINIGTFLLNENQTIYAGSETLIERLDKGETKTIFFTWPEPLVQEPASIDFSWHLNGFEQQVLMP